ncbi:MAG TPA: hypothetical protein VGD43_11085, partial [Micromonospora sp.]
GFDPAEADTAAEEIAGRYLAWLWFLLDAAGTGRQVWRLDPVTSLEKHPGLPGYPALADEAVAELLRQGGADAGPLTVFGYCSAALFARHVVRALVDAGAAPDALVPVAATVPTGSTVWAEFGDLRRKLTGRTAPADPPFPLLDDPEATVGWLRAELTGDARAFVVEQGFDPAEADTAAEEIAGRYLAWLWFLLDAAGTGEVPVPCPVTSTPAEPEAVDLVRGRHAVDPTRAGPAGGRATDDRDDTNDGGTP